MMGLGFTDVDVVPDASAIPGVTWKKVEFDNSDISRVEMAESKDGVAFVRDSENPTGPALVFRRPKRDALVGIVKDGDFDSRS